METTDNTTRKEFFNQMIAKIEKEIKYCTTNIESPMLTRCNCIVATEDAGYQIGLDENEYATVLIGDYTNPVWMTEKAAKNLLYEQNFKASNGNGPLNFTIWGWKSFFKKRRENLITTKASIESVMEMVLA